MKRRRFSERDVLQTLIDKGAPLRCYRCREFFVSAADVEREHLVEIALGGSDTPENCCYSHKHCHAAVTNGSKATTAGSSKQRIAKVKRLRGETCTGPKRKIQSRGFDKTRTRRFDGSVVLR